MGYAAARSLPATGVQTLFVARISPRLADENRRICLSIVDLVTIGQFNFYTELLALLDRCDPAFGAPVAPIYAVTGRNRKVGRQTKSDTWSHPLAVGQPLPSLPVRLSATQTVALDLEASYEETCRRLRIS
jgi:hypothetical protein